MLSRHPIATAAALAIALTVLLTWPQAIHLSGTFAAHQDSFFSTWRLAWIAHALATSPRHLFDGNIFYPALRTLAYSDATMLEGVVGTPLLWTGVPPVMVYNLLLLAGIALSGIGMFLLARHVTGSVRAALVATALFTMAPYRVEHFMHLELQWTVWIPLALLGVHRTVETRSWRWGAATGLFLWLQFVSCVYYGVFLSMAVAVLAVLLLAGSPRQAPAAFAALLVGAMVAAVLAAPYAYPYVVNVRMLGPRGVGDIAMLSAHPISYLASPPENWLWGWTADRFGSMELRLFPGTVAIALAAIGLVWRPRRMVWTYAALGAFTFAVSLGVNGPVYAWLYAHVWAFSGLRAPARMAAVVLCAIVVLAAFGTSRIEAAVAGRGRAAGWLLAGILALIVVDGWSAPMALMPVPETPDVYRFVRTLPAGPMVELPLPTLSALPGNEPQYEFWSIAHWNPLVNGYSGYFPPTYAHLVERMEHFPDDESVGALRRLGVRYVVVHDALYMNADELGRVLFGMQRRHDVGAAGRYRDWIGWADVFEIK